MEKKHFLEVVAILVNVLLKMTLWLCIYVLFTKEPLF